MKKSRKLSGQNYIVFVVAVVVSACFLLGSLLFLNDTRDQNEQKSIQYLYDATSQRQAALDQQIEGDLQVLRGVAVGLAEIDLGNKELILMLLDGVNRSTSFARMGFADTNGMVSLVDLDGVVYANVDLSKTEYFKTALEGNEGISGTLPSPTTGLDVNYYTTPVYQNGEIVGVLCAVNSAEILWNILNVPVFQGQGIFLVTDSEGTIVSPGDPTGSMSYGSDITQLLEFSASEKEELLQTMAAGDSGSFVAEMAGENQIITNYTMNHNDWQVLSIVPYDDITAYYNRTTGGIVTIVLVACLIFVLLLYWQMHMMNRNKKSLERLAYTDALTGASNWVKFLLDADRLLKEKSEKKYAVWSFDIKRFTSINDLFGTETGDQILKWFASTFERMEAKDSALCRVSADLFAGLRPYREKKELHDWISCLWSELGEQQIVPNSKMHIESALGIYCIEDYPDEKPDITNMVNWASMARKKAKQAVGNELYFFSSEMSERVHWEAELESSSKEALLKGDITFFVQPKVNIQDNYAISGVEVLARWKHPDHGWISPAEFVPLFESNGFIVELDRYIFDQACSWYTQRNAQESPTFHLSINVSRCGLLRTDFLEYYSSVKQKYGIADGVLELEFTESVLLEDYSLFQGMVAELQNNGFTCSIDDFGSGYSSLNVLKNLTIDVLKLDAIFFQDGVDIEREKMIISYFIHMALNLGIITVAEGIETVQQVLFLQHAGCEIVQGYYFSKPLSPIQFEQFMEKTKGQLVAPGAEEL